MSLPTHDRRAMVELVWAQVKHTATTYNITSLRDFHQWCNDKGITNDTLAEWLRTGRWAFIQLSLWDES